MDNKNKIELPKKYIDILENYPEQGMGYQIVNVVLIDGRILTNRVVLNSSYLKLERDDNFTVDEIKDIKIN